MLFFFFTRMSFVSLLKDESENGYQYTSGTREIRSYGYLHTHTNTQEYSSELYIFEQCMEISKVCLIG